MSDAPLKFAHRGIDCLINMITDSVDPSTNEQTHIKKTRNRRVGTHAEELRHMYQFQVKSSQAKNLQHPAPPKDYLAAATGL